ncbi:MAG: PfkB family carbohydrate kinase [bacterium]|nr:PfkB family carbohydrate kinase [bacterium]MDE0601662.1 PfkB family carbohydrate kinase [bacterium]
MSGVPSSRATDPAILDLVTVGRVNLDLYSQQIGAPFEEVTGFEAMVGGSPTNIAIGTARLGLRSAAFTAVGQDQVGDLVLHRLAADGVDTRFVLRKPGHLSSLALLGVEPPDHFPLMFYRSDPADIHLTIEDAASLPLGGIRAIQHSGNAFSRGDCAEAARWLVEEGQRIGLSSFLDLDMRPAEWPDPLEYGRSMRFAMARVEVVIGTYEELWGALAPDPGPVLTHGPLTPSQLAATEEMVSDLALRSGGPSTVVLKRGAAPTWLFHSDGTRQEIPGYPAEIVNTVGAGDSFASGVIYSRMTGQDWVESVSFGNACGAITVSRPGCSTAFPTLEEVNEFRLRFA